MATFRNDGNFTTKMVDYEGKEVILYPGSSIKTHEVLGAPFTKTSDEPFYSLAKVQEDSLALPGSVSGLSDCKVIKITTNSGVVNMRCNSLSSPHVTVIPIDSVFEFRNDGSISVLFFSPEEDVEDVTVKVEAYLKEAPILTTTTTTTTEPIAE